MSVQRDTASWLDQGWPVLVIVFGLSFLSILVFYAPTI